MCVYYAVRADLVISVPIPRCRLLAVNESAIRAVLGDDESSGGRYEGFRHSHQSTRDVVHDAGGSGRVCHESVLGLVADPLQARPCVRWGVVQVGYNHVVVHLAHHRVC